MAALARVTEASKKLYRDKIAEVRSYVKSRSLPKDLQLRVVRYFKARPRLYDPHSSFRRSFISGHFFLLSFTRSLRLTLVSYHPDLPCASTS